MQKSSSLSRAILWTTAIAGTLDLSDALIFYRLRGVPMERLLQGIAARLLGRGALADGWKSAALGLAMHYTIACIWSALFILLAQRIALLRRTPLVIGALYGAIVFVVMNDVVLPFTMLYKPLPHDPVIFANAVLALVLFMGIAVALCNRAFAPHPSVS